MLEKLANALVGKGIGTPHSVRNAEGAVVAVALFLHSHHRLINLLLATNGEGKTFGATAFLFDEIIKSNAGGGKVFDFEGSMVPGVAKFYWSFGPREVHYWQLKRKIIPWYMGLFKR